jgi:hypothetical protein
MYTLFATLLRSLSPSATAVRRDPVQQLMERAGARAGHNPRQSRELREAAYAWLRVVR